MKQIQVVVEHDLVMVCTNIYEQLVAEHQSNSLAVLSST